MEIPLDFQQTLAPPLLLERLCCLGRVVRVVLLKPLRVRRTLLQLLSRVRRLLLQLFGRGLCLLCCSLCVVLPEPFFLRRRPLRRRLLLLQRTGILRVLLLLPLLLLAGPLGLPA